MKLRQFYVVLLKFMWFSLERVRCVNNCCLLNFFIVNSKTVSYIKVPYNCCPPVNAKCPHLLAMANKAVEGIFRTVTLFPGDFEPTENQLRNGHKIHMPNVNYPPPHTPENLSWRKWLGILIKMVFICISPPPSPTPPQHSVIEQRNSTSKLCAPGYDFKIRKQKTITQCSG